MAMMMQQATRILATGIIAAACAACAPGGQADGSLDSADQSTGELHHVVPIVAELPSGNLQAKVIEIASDADLLDTVSSTDTAYIHTQSEGEWYFKSGNYLLGIESFTQYHQELNAWVDFDTGSKVAPAQARIVGHSYRGQGWDIPSLDNDGEWPASANSVWVVGTESGILGMGGAPQGIPFGTEVFGSLQTYGGVLSTPYLIVDTSPREDSERIQALFAFDADTLLGGHSAGSSAAKRLARDLGLTNVWLYGTPNYSRWTGVYTQTETNKSTGEQSVAEVINNNNDPVTNCLLFPIHLVSLAWGTVQCHNYSNWDYESTSPEQTVCE
jgi:hypothetical protein